MNITQKSRIILSFLTAVLFISTASAEEVATVSSPDGKNIATISINEDGEMSYAVTRNGQVMISDSRLGFKTSTMNVISNIKLQDSSQKEINESYTLPVGKTSTYVNHCNELTLNLKKASLAFALTFRAYNEGIAFRYSFSGTGNINITADSTEVVVPTVSKVWAMNYTRTYEAYYNGRTWVQISHLSDPTFCCPMLIRSSLGNDYYTLISEACIDSNGCASALLASGRTDKGRLTFVAQSSVAAPRPFEMPWKVVFMGSLPEIVESSMVENLNPPTAFEDISWIKPGLSSWDWGGNDGRQIRDMEWIKKTIDEASEMGWPYMTLDDGWDGADYELSEVTSYAAEKGVQVFIWSHQNRFKNDEEHIRSILSEWKSLGFAGSKIDFFEDDSQSMMKKYERLLKVAGELKMMLNFHGATKPSGRRRTYPNHLASEGVYGNEMYYYIGDACPANHNVNLCLTRNVVGPMEYTPGEYANRNGVVRHGTTWSGQTALVALFESGIQTIADCYDNIINNVAAPVLKVIPAAWDETRCQEAEPDSYITMMRRSGDDWYVATISKQARTASIPLSFLGAGTYTAQIWGDGTCPSDIVYSDAVVNSSSTLDIPVKAGGGAIIRISKNPVYQSPYIRTEMENGTISNATVTTDNNGNCSEGKYVSNIGNGSRITCKVDVPAAGRYHLTLYYISWEDRDLYFEVNGGEKDYHTIPGNGGTWNTDGLQFHTYEVTLQRGTNTIAFGNDNGWAPDLDRFVLNPVDKVVATGIENRINETEALGKRYNQIGQNVGENYRGIIIQNGKKIIKR